MVFLDTEFTDFINCDLISIGLVAEDGTTMFYGERSDFRREWCSNAVIYNIVPMLNAATQRTQHQLRQELSTWLLSFERPIRILTDSSTDWELLIDLFDGTLPPGVVGHTLMSEERGDRRFAEAVYAYHSWPGQPWHHALHDACANRAGWISIHGSHRAE